jgi:hypothetical protein
MPSRWNHTGTPGRPYSGGPVTGRSNHHRVGIDSFQSLPAIHARRREPGRVQHRRPATMESVTCQARVAPRTMLGHPLQMAVPGQATDAPVHRTRAEPELAVLHGPAVPGRPSLTYAYSVIRRHADPEIGSRSAMSAGPGPGDRIDMIAQGDAGAVGVFRLDAGQRERMCTVPGLLKWPLTGLHHLIKRGMGRPAQIRCCLPESLAADRGGGETPPVDSPGGPLECVQAGGRPGLRVLRGCREPVRTRIAGLLTSCHQRANGGCAASCSLSSSGSSTRPMRAAR